MGPSARDALAQILDQAGGAGNGIVATVVGVVLLLVGASGAFAELQDGLNNIWKVKPKPGLGIWELIKNRLLSITVVLGTGFLLLVSLVLSAVLSALGGWMENHLPGSAWIWQVLNGALSFAVVALLFAMIFKILPDARIDWRDVWIGAVVTAALFTIGKAVIGAYLGRSGLAATYGAAGSIVVLLTWVYYSAVILLFGAEFTHVYALATRRHVEPMDHAVHDKPASQGRMRLESGVIRPRRRPYKIPGVCSGRMRLCAAWRESNLMDWWYYVLAAAAGGIGALVLLFLMLLAAAGSGGLSRWGLARTAFRRTLADPAFAAKVQDLITPPPPPPPPKKSGARAAPADAVAARGPAPRFPARGRAGGDATNRSVPACASCTAKPRAS